MSTLLNSRSPRATRVLRPTPATFVLLALLIALGASWSARHSRTDFPDGRVRLRGDYGVGSLIITSSWSPDTEVVRSYEIDWLRLGLSILGICAVARALAWAGERAAAGTLSLGRWVLASVGVAVAIAFLVATFWTRSYWGFFFRRPPVAESIEGLDRLDAISLVRCEGDGASYRCSPPDDRTLEEEVSYCRGELYECCGERIALALSDAGRLSSDLAEIPPAQFREIERFLGLPDRLVRPEAGYGGNDRLSGVTASGRTKDGRSVVALGLQGGEVANDHYPCYLSLLALGADGMVPLRSRTMFIDIAGIEGFEWKAMFVTAAVIGLSICSPMALAAAALVGYLRRRRVRHSVPAG